MTGISNVGKSSLMRLLAHADVWLQQLGDDGGSFLPVYIDCNRMLEMTEQGFYELVLRCLQESSPLLAQDQELQTAYAALVAPANVFQVPLSFSNALNAALQKTQFKLVLLFDEFDEPFQQIRHPRLPQPAGQEGPFRPPARLRNRNRSAAGNLAPRRPQQRILRAVLPSAPGISAPCPATM